MFVKSIITLSRRQKAVILLTVDLTLVVASFLLALKLIYVEGLAPAEGAGVVLAQLPALLGLAAAASFPLGLMRIRLRDYRSAGVMRSVALAATLATGSFVQAQIGGLGGPLGLHVLFGLLCFFAFFLSRVTLIWVLEAIYRHSRNLQRVAIYGAGRTGMAMAHDLRQREDVVVCAFLDDNAALRGMTLNGLQVYPGVQAAQVIERHKIDRVILAMPSLSSDRLTFLSKRLETLGLQVQSLPAFTQWHGSSDLLDMLRPIGPAALLHRAPLCKELSPGVAAYRDANVLISGAGGSIGLELCRQVLACRPRKLVLFELSEFALYRADAELRVLAEGAGVDIVPVLGSVADAMQVRRVLQAHDIGVVLHAAAYKHVPLVEINPLAGLANNTLGTAVLAREARDCGVGRFVLVSSDKAVRPGNLMGASKRLAELAVQDLATRPKQTVFSIVRFGNVLGSSGSVVPLFQEQINRGGPVTLTDERVTRYFMTIQEASKLVLLAGAQAEGGEVFVLDMGQPLRILDLAHRLIHAAGYTVRDADNPDGDIEIVVTGLRPGEKLHEELMMRRGAATTAHPKIIAVREDHLSELETAAALRDLREAIERGSEADAITALAWAVPEYAPKSLPEDALPCRVVRARRKLDVPAE